MECPVRVVLGEVVSVGVGLAHRLRRARDQSADLALEPILLKLQRPMAINLRREAQLLGPDAGIRRHEQLVVALETNDRQRILPEFEAHGGRRFLTTSADMSPAVAVGKT